MLTNGSSKIACVPLMTSTRMKHGGRSLVSLRLVVGHFTGWKHPRSTHGLTHDFKCNFTLVVCKYFGFVYNKWFGQ